MNRLPTHVQAILAAFESHSLDEITKIADSIMRQGIAPSVSPTPTSSDAFSLLVSELNAVKLEIALLQKANTSSPRSQKQTGRATSPPSSSLSFHHQCIMPPQISSAPTSHRPSPEIILITHHQVPILVYLDVQIFMIDFVTITTSSLQMLDLCSRLYALSNFHEQQAFKLPRRCIPLKEQIPLSINSLDMVDASPNDHASFIWLTDTHNEITFVMTRDVEAVEYFVLPLPAPLEVSCFRVCFRFLILKCFASASGSFEVSYASASSFFFQSASASTRN